jgi:hypothetical protein
MIKTNMFTYSCPQYEENQEWKPMWHHLLLGSNYAYPQLWDQITQKSG